MTLPTTTAITNRYRLVRRGTPILIAFSLKPARKQPTNPIRPPIFAHAMITPNREISLPAAAKTRSLHRLPSVIAGRVVKSGLKPLRQRKVPVRWP